MIGLFLAGGLVVASPAFAEDCSGSFVDFSDGEPIPCFPQPDGDYYFYDDGFGSAPTALHLVNCSANPDITLWWYRGQHQWDWVSMGTKRFWCLNTDGGWKEWGSGFVEGWYSFNIEDPRSANGLLSVGYFHAGW